MAIFDPDVLNRLERLSLRARHSGGRSLLAVTPRRQPTTLREYVPGDDYRAIDWTVCARRDELFTKTAQGGEDRHVYILLDCSPSMGLGAPSKFDLARRIAAALGYVALASLDRLSVLAYSDGIVAESPAIRGRPRAAKLLQFLEGLSLQGARTDLARTAGEFVRRHQRRGPTVVISDLYDRVGFARGFDMLQYHGYDLRVLHLFAPEEAEPALSGDVELIDVESGAVAQATITEGAARRYRAIFADFCGSVRAYCARRGVACVQIASDTPEDEVFQRVFVYRGPLQLSATP